MLLKDSTNPKLGTDKSGRKKGHEWETYERRKSTCFLVAIAVIYCKRSRLYILNLVNNARSRCQVELGLSSVCGSPRNPLVDHIQYTQRQWGHWPRIRNNIKCEGSTTEDREYRDKCCGNVLTHVAPLS